MEFHVYVNYDIRIGRGVPLTAQKEAHQALQLALPAASSAPSTAKPAGGASVLDEIKSRGKIVVGVKFDTKLFGLKNPTGGEVEGFDIDIAKALAKEILGDEKKIELKEVTSKRVFRCWTTKKLT